MLVARQHEIPAASDDFGELLCRDAYRPGAIGIGALADEVEQAELDAQTVCDANDLLIHGAEEHLIARRTSPLLLDRRHAAFPLFLVGRRTAGGKPFASESPSVGSESSRADVRSLGVKEEARFQAIESLDDGTLDEAVAAIGRLLAVTEASYERRAQLEQALKSRVAIEQAKGILAERYGLELDVAFDVIRRAARSNRMKLHDLVAKIEPGKPTPDELTPLL
jgi:hypothetical protein